jgi:bile acid:Na+ symporter, BASS family
LSIGPTLVLAVVVHNTLGYVLGYWGCRLLGMEESIRRTVAIEVGLQNGGMAAQLATDVLKSANAALAAVVFAPWMNLSGSLLAAWWHRSAENLQTETPMEPLRGKIEVTVAD